MAIKLITEPGRAGRAVSFPLLVALAVVGGSLATHRSAQAQYVGEVVCGGWNFCPTGWMECNGQLLTINANNALFALLGTTYGGDGVQNFAVPNLQSRTVLHQGAGPGLSNRSMGEVGGAENVALTVAQMPGHGHTVAVHTGGEKSASPVNRIPGFTPNSAPVYGSTVASSTLNSGTLSNTGGSQPHNNLQPYASMTCCISLFGVFPPRN